MSERSETSQKQLRAGASNGVTIKINGKDIPLNPFVQKVIKNINLAVIEALKTEVNKPKDIEIRIKL